MSGDKKLFSAEEEVALHPERAHETPPAPEPPPEEKPEAGPSDYYLSAHYEPGLKTAGPVSVPPLPGSGDSPAFCLMLTLLCGFLGGLLSVPAVILQGQGSWFRIFALVVFGPLAEEALKPCGMIFLLEKRPGSVRAAWQIFLAGAIGGAVFAVVENLIYGKIYLRNLPADRLTMVMAFRWTVCTTLHIGCTLISALGLRRAWLRARRTGLPFQLSDAYHGMAAAIAVHGCYNLTAMLFLQKFFGGK
ncbi:MAG: PrsW family intramembrane metalloprotease [Lentisphaeria bacterium]|nr:PrsW family intramembrane metalloprotease [Lentisphaeria bacterium]